MRYAGRTRGFTLIELLVVIAVIALLVAILMPTLNQAKELALRAKCSAYLKNIGSGIHQYAADNKGWLPWAGSSSRAEMMSDPTASADYALTEPTDTDTLGNPHQLGLLWAKYANEAVALQTNYPGGTPGYQYWRYMLGNKGAKPLPGEYADYLPSLDNFYCPGKDYDNNPHYNSYTIESQGGYAYFVPGYVNGPSDTDVRRFHIDDEGPKFTKYQGPSLGGWELWLKNNNLTHNILGSCSYAWEYNGDSAGDDIPHWEQGRNLLYRDGSSHWITHGDLNAPIPPPGYPGAMVNTWQSMDANFWKLAIQYAAGMEPDISR